MVLAGIVTWSLVTPGSMFRSVVMKVPVGIADVVVTVAAVATRGSSAVGSGA
jgi:hypothetical protein